MGQQHVFQLSRALAENQKIRAHRRHSLRLCDEGKEASMGSCGSRQEFLLFRDARPQ
jgi:hypothetical protein